jgi:hypothetical protein
MPHVGRSDPHTGHRNNPALVVKSEQPTNTTRLRLSTVIEREDTICIEGKRQRNPMSTHHSGSRPLPRLVPGLSCPHTEKQTAIGGQAGSYVGREIHLIHRSIALSFACGAMASIRPSRLAARTVRLLPIVS